MTTCPHCGATYEHPAYLQQLPITYSTLQQSFVVQAMVLLPVCPYCLKPEAPQ